MAQSKDLMRPHSLFRKSRKFAANWVRCGKSVILPRASDFGFRADRAEAPRERSAGGKAPGFILRVAPAKKKDVHGKLSARAEDFPSAGFMV